MRLRGESGHVCECVCVCAAAVGRFRRSEYLMAWGWVARSMCVKSHWQPDSRQLVVCRSAGVVRRYLGWGVDWQGSWYRLDASCVDKSAATPPLAPRLAPDRP